MKKAFKIFIGSIAFCFLCFCIIIIGYFSNIVFPWERKESIKNAIEMGGLSDLPSNAEDIEIERRGSMFTRQYIIEFKATETEIKKWIEKSKRLKDNSPKKQGNIKVYEIYPGENDALGGKVKIDKNKVHINMSWS